MKTHVRIWTWEQGNLDGDKYPLPDINWTRELPHEGDRFDVPVGGVVTPNPWDKTSPIHPGVVARVHYTYPDPTATIYIQLL